jgi:hypothetical protein
MITTTALSGEPGEAHRELRGHGSNADLLVQSQAWYQFHHLALRLDGRARTSNPRLPKPVRSRCATSRCTHGGSRTRTDEALDLVPLTNRRASRSEAEARPAGGWATVLTVGFEPTLAAV